MNLLKSTRPTDEADEPELWDQAIQEISAICAKEKLAKNQGKNVNEVLTPEEKERVVYLQNWAVQMGQWLRNQAASKNANKAMNSTSQTTNSSNMAPTTTGGRRKRTQRKNRKQRKQRKQRTYRKRN